MTAPAPPGVRCVHCGTADHGDARFCGVCGRAISATEPSNPNLAERPSLIGREIAGRYRIQALLGEGGMGAVFRAEQISLKRTVAVKLLRPEILGNQMLLRRFNLEAEAVAKLSHPGTVNIYDFGQDADGTLFIAMELIDGRSLRQVIHREAPLPPRRALAIAAQVAASLADAHAHAIVHRDLKPDNVMLQDRGRERDVVRVLDFGIAKLRDETRATHAAMTQQGDLLGTPQYMAPEQIRAEPIDGRTDVYALGCMLYVMVTGRLPHEAPTVLGLLSKHLIEHPVPPSQRRPELGLPAALDHLILGAMAKRPDDRPATMEAMGEQIAALLASQPAEPSRSAAHPVAVAGSTVASGPTAVPPAAARLDTPPSHSAVQAAPATWPPAASPGPRPASRRRTAALAIAGVVAAGAAGATAVVVVTRSAADRPVIAAPPIAAPPPPPTAEPRPAPDPWATTSTIDGTRVAVGQGVGVIIPSGFRTASLTGYVAAQDPRGVMIMAGPIALPTDDPQQLAQDHARLNHLVFDAMDHVFVGGIRRPMARFHGSVNGIAVHHVAVALIGPGYRVAVVFQAPVQIASDPAVEALALELFTQRITLP